jgi:hypothetical protein
MADGTETRVTEAHKSLLKDLQGVIKVDEEAARGRDGLPLYCDSLALVGAYRLICGYHFVTPVNVIPIRAAEFFGLYIEGRTSPDCAYLLHQAAHFVLVFDAGVSSSHTVILINEWYACINKQSFTLLSVHCTRLRVPSAAVAHAPGGAGDGVCTRHCYPPSIPVVEGHCQY